MTITVLSNCTQRLRAFFLHSGNKITPEKVTFSIYDSNKEEIFSEELDPDTNQLVCKDFFYDKKFDTVGEFFFEFKGQTGEYEYTDRGKIEVIFCEDES